MSHRILLVLLILFQTSKAQLTIPMKVFWNNEEVKQDGDYSFNQAGMHLSELKFYLSNVTANTVNVERNSNYVLFSLEQENNALVIPSTKQLHNVCFTLGIDSITNASGVMGETLDPTQGMYWTWQSGYINFKLEASYHARKLEYHLGGYSYPYNSSREVCLNTLSKNPVLIFHLDTWLHTMGNPLPPNIMSPGETAMRASDLLIASFELR